ncbi:MAG: MarR family transcriptional regulator [Gaiella sp.]|nr:MarR family transcriptional regulator [Gaiella sp.]
MKQLSALEFAAWGGFLRTHAELVRALDRELETRHGLPLTQYEVLLHLEAAPEHRLRMSELARSVLLSQSGITRLVDRLEARGLVERAPCAEDRRVLWAQLTDEGAACLAEARPTHLAGVRARFVDQFDEDGLRALGDAWERLQATAVP